MKWMAFSLVVLFSSVVGFAEDDTNITFGKISSGASGLKVTSVASQNNADSEGRFGGFALVEGSDAMRLDAVKLSAVARPQGGTKLSTTTAISNGSASADVVSGAWTRPQVVPTLGAFSGGSCPISWTDAIGVLPEPDGVYAFLDAYYCMTSSTTCSPSAQFSRYYGAGGPDWVYSGERVCATTGIYGYDNYYGTAYSLEGDTNVICTGICS